MIATYDTCTSDAPFPSWVFSSAMMEKSGKPPLWRWAAAAIATILVAPLVSPAYLFWVFVSLRGAVGFEEITTGLLSGAAMATIFGWPAAVVGVVALTLITSVRYAAWSQRHWVLWALLGAAIGGGGATAFLLATSASDVILAGLLLCAPAGALAALVFRAILLGR